MAYWVGLVGFALGGWLFYRAFAHKKRADALAAARAAAPGGAQELEPMHPSLQDLAEMVPPLVTGFVMVAGAMITIAFFALRAQTDVALSLFDLGGVWAALLGYGRWVSWKSKYRTGGRVREAGAADEVERAGSV